MTTKDAHDHDVSSSTLPTTIAKLECCMCGDYGLSQQLFRCRVCLSRFQHRYCSNLYPKAEIYRVCNWCLNKEGTKLEAGGGTKLERTRSFASLSFTYRSNNNTKGEEEEDKKKKIKRNDHGNNHISNRIISSMKVRRGETSSSSTSSNDQLHVKKNSSIKKQSAHSDQSIGKKKIVFRSEGSLRRTKSEVFRGKVQRYKLLEEVCIQ
ncbi:hypothetical protein AQUCO_01500206v1 [Aquilegia coerulea]|uniref:PHD-type zinc finger plants domain-containing protein n=2 Tax=Aquilegia coerulea TaxID=218851 RepID=A0A2G5DSM3_AQUCA|nr:hypothetical protein AQUCO_01500206v1 [Aquilegia coerulea]